MATVWSSNVTSLQAEQHGTQLVCVCKKKEKKRNNSPALPIFTILHKQHLDLHAYLFDYIYWNGTKSARLWILRHCCDRFQRRYANKEQLWFWVVLKSSFLSLPPCYFQLSAQRFDGKDCWQRPGHSHATVLVQLVPRACRRAWHVDRLRPEWRCVCKVHIEILNHA